MRSSSSHTGFFRTTLLAVAIFLLPMTTNATTPNAALVNFLKAPSQSVPQNCGAFDLSGMKDGESYSLYIRGTSSGTCTFRATGLTFRYPPNYGATTEGARSLFSFQRFGADVVVGWSTGY